jgi:hypothetical protein
LVSGTKNLVELREKTPEELHNLAAKLVREHASSEAMDDMDTKPNEKRDQQK